MATMKNVLLNQNGELMVIDQPAPIQRIDKSAIDAAVARVGYLVPNVTSKQHLTTIAQETILYRLVPDRDVHYFEKGGKLHRVYDYKFLMNFAIRKEKMITGRKDATLEYDERPMTDEERVLHGVGENDFAAVVTITTDNDRQRFANEVKRWKETGLNVKEAIAMARELLGEIGVSAVGVVEARDNIVPVGWTKQSKAGKLALKNAINRRYGIPTADEMIAMAREDMSIGTQQQDWDNVPIDEPIDVQKRLAQLEAISREAKAAAANSTAEERAERLEGNIILLRGEDEGAIGDDWAVTAEPQFVYRVIEEIPFYGDDRSVLAALQDLGLKYSAANEDMLIDELARYAARLADKQAAQGQGESNE